MHFFQYDYNIITNCIWDGYINYNDKTNIVYSIFQWLNNSNFSYNFSLYNSQDNYIFCNISKTFN